MSLELDPKTTARGWMVWFQSPWKVSCTMSRARISFAGMFFPSG